MVAIDPTKIPPTILTAEGRAAYHLAILHDMFGEEKYAELPGQEMTKLVTCMVGKAYDGTHRLIYRASFELHPNWSTSGNKLWDDVLPYASATIPARYLVA